MESVISDALEREMNTQFERTAAMENYILGERREYETVDGRAGFDYQSREANELWEFFRFGYIAGTRTQHVRPD